MYKLSFNVMQCKEGDWGMMRDEEGNQVEYPTPQLAKSVAKWLVYEGLAEQAFGVKVEVSVCYDVVTRQEMLHTQYTGLVEGFQQGSARLV